MTGLPPFMSFMFLLSKNIESALPRIVHAFGERGRHGLEQRGLGSVPGQSHGAGRLPLLRDLRVLRAKSVPSLSASVRSTSVSSVRNLSTLLSCRQACSFRYRVGELLRRPEIIVELAIEAALRIDHDGAEIVGNVGVLTHDDQAKGRRERGERGGRRGGEEPAIGVVVPVEIPSFVGRGARREAASASARNCDSSAGNNWAEGSA